VIAEKTRLIVRPLKGLAVFKRPEDPIKKALDAEILGLLEDMRVHTEYDEEYEKMATTIAKLYEFRLKERVSMDTIVTVATHLAGLAVIVHHERVHVIVSKAFGLIKKIV
jgi:hypothetical protein